MLPGRRLLLGDLSDLGPAEHEDVGGQFAERARGDHQARGDIGQGCADLVPGAETGSTSPRRPATNAGKRSVAPAGSDVSSAYWWYAASVRRAAQRDRQRRSGPGAPAGRRRAPDAARWPLSTRR